MAYDGIMRMAGEGFDADQVTLPCETCGRSEYSCECGLETCDHVLFVEHGQIVCRRCRSIYRIGMAGSRWVDPASDEIDMQPLAVMLNPSRGEQQ